VRAAAAREAAERAATMVVAAATEAAAGAATMVASVAARAVAWGVGARVGAR
jgi:hypothetical protein